MKYTILVLTFIALAGCVERTGTRGVVLTDTGVQVSSSNPGYVAAVAEAVKHHCKSSNISSAQIARIENAKNRLSDEAFERRVQYYVDKFAFEKMPCKKQSEEEKNNSTVLTGSLFEQAAYIRVCPNYNTARKAEIEKRIVKLKQDTQVLIERKVSFFITEDKTEQRIEDAVTKLRNENVTCNRT